MYSLVSIPAGHGIYILLPPPVPPIFPQPGLCSVVVWNSPDVSCGLISGYELELFIDDPQNPYQYNMNQKLVRQVGPSGTYYILKDEDRLEGRVPTHVRVLAIYS